MTTSELQTILGYVNIGLALAHNSGVAVGHFGATDFIQLAQTVNNLLLQAITPATPAPVSSAPPAPDSDASDTAVVAVN